MPNGPDQRKPPNLLRNGDYFKVWTAETASAFGTQITTLALPILAVTTLGASPLEFGLLSTVAYVPYVLVSLPAGVWVDRMRRRPVLIAADLGRAISLLSLPLVFALGSLSMFQLYVVAFVNGTLSVFFELAHRSYVPSLVERDRLVESNSTLEVSRSAAELIGPSFAGLLIGLLRAPFAIVVDAISFLVSAVSLYWIRRPEPPIETTASVARKPRALWREIFVGLRYIGGHRWLRAIAASAWTANFFANVIWAILILYLVRERSFTPASVGFALSIGSVGALVAASVAARVTKHIGVGRALMLAAVGFSVARVPLAVSPEPLLFWALALTVLIGGGSIVLWNVNSLSLRQAIAPLAFQGRLTASSRFIVWSSIPLGSLSGALLAEFVGLEQTIWVGALGGLIAFVPVARSSVRAIVDLPDPTDESAIRAAGLVSGGDPESAAPDL